MLKGTPQLRKHPACIVQLTKQRFYFLPNCLIVGIWLNIEYNSRRADDEFREGILVNQKFKKMYYLNVSESGIGSR
jgi:hypothetical protein